jgi:hypothetical protein
MSLIDDCVFLHSDIILMVYVDDGIFLGSNNLQLLEVIKEIQDLGLNIEDQGHPADYVGVNIKKLKDGSYEFTQRALIDSIINGVGLKDVKVKPVPANVSLQLLAFKDEPALGGLFSWECYPTYFTFDLNLQPPNWGQTHQDFWWVNQPILWLR